MREPDPCRHVRNHNRSKSLLPIVTDVGVMHYSSYISVFPWLYNTDLNHFLVSIGPKSRSIMEGMIRLTLKLSEKSAGVL